MAVGGADQKVSKLIRSGGNKIDSTGGDICCVGFEEGKMLLFSVGDRKVMKPQAYH